MHEDWEDFWPFPEDEDDEDDELDQLFEEDIEEMDLPTRRRVVSTPKIAPQLQPQSTGGGALDEFAQAIQKHEGWFSPGGQHPTGSTSYRNNNPGNLKFVGQRESIGADGRGFAVFPSYSAGFRALKSDIVAKFRRNPGWSIRDFVSVYAPASDFNDVEAYAEAIASHLRATTGNYVSKLTRLNELFT